MKAAGCSSLKTAVAYIHQDAVEEVETVFVQATSEQVNCSISMS